MRLSKVFSFFLLLLLGCRGGKELTTPTYRVQDSVISPTFPPYLFEGLSSRQKLKAIESISRAYTPPAGPRVVKNKSSIIIKDKSKEKAAKGAVINSGDSATVAANNTGKGAASAQQQGKDNVATVTPPPPPKKVPLWQVLIVLGIVCFGLYKFIMWLVRKWRKTTIGI